MYAVIKNDNVIAIHDKLETVEKFIKQEKNNDMEIIKIKKKKKSRKLYEKYSNLYLVRYGDRYIPQELFETIEKEDEQANYDLSYCCEVLYRVLNDGEKTNKEIKYLLKSIEIIKKEMTIGENIDIDTLYKIKEMDNQFKERL